MISSKVKFILVLLGISAILFPKKASYALPVTINFDELSNNTTVNNQFSEATFSSNTGFEIRTIGEAWYWGTSQNNFICPYNLSGFRSCNQDVFVNFTNPVYDLKFFVTGDHAVGKTGLVNVFDMNGLIDTIPIMTDGQRTGDLVDLTKYTNIERIQITSITDPGGLAYDDFTFKTTAVPEPLTILGAATAIVFGTAFKGRLSQTKKK